MNGPSGARRGARRQGIALAVILTASLLEVWAVMSGWEAVRDGLLLVIAAAMAIAAWK